MTTSLTERQPLPPIKCQPWCVHQDGHPGEIFEVDQRCESPYLTVDLALWPIFDTQKNEVLHPDQLAVYAEHVPNGKIRVVIERVDEAPAATLTLAETRQLVDNLQLLLGQVEAQS